MTSRYDVAVVGGGPAGAAAAWQATQAGARVVVFDKAQFPRDKPCGDGLTPRAVSFIQKIGLAEQVAKFHRVNRAYIRNDLLLFDGRNLNCRVLNHFFIDLSGRRANNRRRLCCSGQCLFQCLFFY